MLEGILGAEIAGKEEFPSRGSAKHRTGSSCVQCHMGESNDVELGGHSWTPVDAVCIGCHQAVPGEADGFDDDMEELVALLLRVEGVDPNGDPIVGILYYDEEQEGYYANVGTWPDVAAMAAWNYKYAYEDQSEGVHNPNYTKALLKNSIEAVKELLNAD